MDYNLAQAYVTALTGSPDTVCDWRTIHDTDKSLAAHNHRGTLRDVWATLCDYNQRGWGVFITVSDMDGVGRELSNVRAIRAHCVDLDNLLSAQDSYNRAIATYPQPHFAVQTSEGKYHLYWLVEPYVGNDYYTGVQRKLRQLYDGDRSVIDATRVLRVPGFYHLKAEPFMVTCWGIHGGARWPVLSIEATLAHVNVIDHVGMRSPLGDASMAAPSLDWLKFALNLLNPNELDRSEWMSISAAFKQSGWTLADEPTLLSIWNEWCAQYSKNDVGENLKLWHSFRETEVGWTAFERRTVVKAHMMHYGLQNAPAVTQGAVQPREPVVGAGNSVGAVPTRPTTSSTDNMGELLSGEECKLWFENCYFISRTGEIFGPRGRYMNSTQFNGLYGGKHFIITGNGKITDEPWKAALRSTVYTIPKVDHVRFLPDRPTFDIIVDGLNRKGLNTYIPVTYRAKEGDVSLWLNHVAQVLPDERDRKIWFDYMAHCVKYPGYKIPWAPLLQSSEGAGKTIFTKIMAHALGDMYTYQPKAPELVTSGSKFNAWMRGKLMIMVDEIRVDEKRDLVEILKPMISEARVEVQAKGVDQEMEDNVANWMFFSNFKDAIPINQNGRRYAVFFSAIQSKRDLKIRGMDDAYFERLYTWVDFGGGAEAITHWLLTYPIEKGAIPRVAPESSTHAQAINVSRSPMQIIIEDCVADGISGFRGGYISSLAVSRRVTAAGVRAPSANAMRGVLETMGYHELGRALACYPSEDLTNRAIIYGKDMDMPLGEYARVQGYEG